MELQPARLLCPWDFLGKNPRVVAISSSRGSSQPRDQTWIYCIAGKVFTSWATWEAFIWVLTDFLFFKLFEESKSFPWPLIPHAKLSLPPSSIASRMFLNSSFLLWPSCFRVHTHWPPPHSPAHSDGISSSCGRSRRPELIPHRDPTRWTGRHLHCFSR